MKSILIFTLCIFLSACATFDKSKAESIATGFLDGLIAGALNK